VAPFLSAFNVQNLTFWQIVIVGIAIGLGIAFFTWLIAGYYERRGGFGKK
jgi:hypothetical protein